MQLILVIWYQIENDGFNDEIRGIWAGGGFTRPNQWRHNIIDYVTIATTGNSVDFGDDSQSQERRQHLLATIFNKRDILLLDPEIVIQIKMY